MEEHKVSIPEYFKDKNVFITGGSGFIGKVLVEKLLRSCPDVGNLYLLMRAKKGKTEKERIEVVTCLPLFDRLREEHPENLKKIKIVSGDMMKLNLDLSEAEQNLLIEKTNIIFHGAASVRFDDPLKTAIIMNTRGTREVINLALRMKCLEVFNYISTTYCQTDKAVIKEQLYPACVDWRTAIEIGENTDSHLLNILEKKYIGHFPNTYTFTKSLTEQMIDDLCSGKIRTLIVRPSIVISTIKEPMPGWIDNFNGPVGILIGCAKGVVRTMYTNPNITADYVPVDFVVKSLIAGVWKKSSECVPIFHEVRDWQSPSTTPEVQMETIPKFFENKNILITGGSGFIGKVLIEKLLRSCPAIGSIYLLMRSKKGLNIEERIKKITDQPLFDLLREEHPENFKKIKLVNGDVTKIGLGLCDDDRHVLVKEVNIIYHGAASVRFDDPLIDAILMNTRGTREIISLGLQMENLEVFVHISTTYCHTDKEVIEEITYPPLTNWEKAINLAETGNREQVDILTKKIIHPLPNTYTFTKRLSENVAEDMCKNKIPLVIIRPSIVISTAKEPMPGWIDNFNGPVGIMVAAGKGIVRTSYNDPDNIADYIPVDILVKGMIISVWKKMTIDDHLNVSIYNGSSNKYDPMTVREITEVGSKLAWKFPLNTPLWYPGGSPTRCFYKFYISFIAYHLIPAIIVDGLLKLTGYKPLLCKIQRRIYAANMALQYFTLNEWTFENSASSMMEDHLSTEDRNDFGFHREEINAIQYFTDAVQGGRRYLMKEPDSTLEAAKKNLRRLWYLHLAFDFLWYALLFWVCYVKLDLFSYINNKMYNAYVYFNST